MSNQKMSQKEEIKQEKSIQKLINISSTEGSYDTNETQRNSHQKDVTEFLYYTPMKKKQLNYFPSTPKKEKKILHYENLVGRNLRTIFESMSE